MYLLKYTAQAKKDAKKLTKSGLKEDAKSLLDIIVVDPYQEPPPVKVLVGDLTGALSRRISYQHRLVYQVVDDKFIKIIRMWSHYE
ncbi:Txe/YoeB family addiction module toxin [Piscirickettsia litoralis]|uniref:Putative mRNA interferase YoeB n=1 Tax=Piscirickettsia litoralis TaxID=1891921 RepID=A0ABX3A3A3_9GAMM|nr:Txe/YoeB family addiction module toxin [Piscirickettsia litoralis]ODN43351.1 toxin of toxin-antitoxin system [Piscirickettsia litoralis]